LVAAEFVCRAIEPRKFETTSIVFDLRASTRWKVNVAALFTGGCPRCGARESSFWLQDARTKLRHRRRAMQLIGRMGIRTLPAQIVTWLGNPSPDRKYKGRTTTVRTLSLNLRDPYPKRTVVLSSYARLEDERGKLLIEVSPLFSGPMGKFPLPHPIFW